MISSALCIWPLTSLTHILLSLTHSFPGTVPLLFLSYGQRLFTWGFCNNYSFCLEQPFHWQSPGLCPQLFQTVIEMLFFSVKCIVTVIFKSEFSLIQHSWSLLSVPDFCFLVLLPFLPSYIIYLLVAICVFCLFLWRVNLSKPRLLFITFTKVSQVPRKSWHIGR